MDFLDIISAVANILAAVSVTAHFFHSLWKCRTSVSVRPPCMEVEERGECTPHTAEVVLGRGPPDEERLGATRGTPQCTLEGLEVQVLN